MSLPLNLGWLSSLLCAPWSVVEVMLSDFGGQVREGPASSASPPWDPQPEGPTAMEDVQVP